MDKPKLPDNINDIARTIVLEAIFKGDAKLSKFQLRQRGLSSPDILLLVRFKYIKPITDHSGLVYYVLGDA